MKKYKVVGKDFNGNDILKTYYEWDPNKVAIVKRIAREYMAGKGIWAICKDLNDEGIPSPQGKQWGRSVLPVILKNPIYAGWVRFGWKTTKNGVRIIQPRENWIMHKAEFGGIWDDDYDKKLQAEIERRATLGGRTIMSKALLIGLLKCGWCDYSMFQITSRRTFKNGTKYLWKGYGCGSFLHKGTCRHNGKLQKVIHDLVLKEVLKLANDKARATYLEKVNKSKTDNRVELYKLKDREFKKRLDEFDRINRAYKEGVDSLAEYKKNKEELLPILEKLQKELISLNAQANTPIVKLDWDKQYKSILSKFIESPSEEDVPTIRKILVSLIDKIAFKSKPLYIKIFYKTTPKE